MAWLGDHWLDLVGWCRQRAADLLAAAGAGAAVPGAQPRRLPGADRLQRPRSASGRWSRMNVALAVDQRLVHRQAARASATTRPPSRCSRSARTTTTSGTSSGSTAPTSSASSPDFVWDPEPDDRPRVHRDQGRRDRRRRARDRATATSPGSGSTTSRRATATSPPASSSGGAAGCSTASASASVRHARRTWSAPYYDRVGFRHAEDGESLRASDATEPALLSAAGRRDPAVERAPSPRRSRPPSGPARAPAASASAGAVPGVLVHGERGAGVEQHGVAHRAGLAVERAAVRRRRCGPRRRRAAPRWCRARCRSRPGRRTLSRTSPACTHHTREVVVVVSSSSPSSPRNTQASTPRRANTPAITGAIRGSAQPIACAAGAGRVGQRAEEVERGADAELAARHRRRAASPGGRRRRSRR